MKEKHLTTLLNRVSYLKAFKTGDFLLASGKKSDFYFRFLAKRNLQQGIK